MHNSKLKRVKRETIMNGKENNIGKTKGKNKK